MSLFMFIGRLGVKDLVVVLLELMNKLNWYEEK